MSDTKEKVKSGIDDAAEKAKEVTENTSDKAKEVAQERGGSRHGCGREGQRPREVADLFLRGSAEECRRLEALDKAFAKTSFCSRKVFTTKVLRLVTWLFDSCLGRRSSWLCRP